MPVDLNALPVEPGVGSTVTLTALISTDAGVAVDPTGIVFTYRKPDGAETSVPKVALTSSAVGTWTYQVIADQPGTWTWRVVTTAPGDEQEAVFGVDPSAIAGERWSGEGPCQPWCTVAQVKDGWTPPTGMSPTVLERACAAASQAAFGLGGHRWPGECWDTVLPSVVRAGDVSAAFTMWPSTGGGIGMLPGSVGQGRASVSQSEWLNAMLLDLGASPVTKVEEVRLSGDVLDAASYAIVDGRYLIRTDGSAWPSPNSPWFSPPLIAVDFTYGAAPPPLGVEAAVALARQLAVSIGGGDGCTLNRRVRSVVRENVSIDIAVPGLIDALRDGYTGVPEVDLFIATVNPHRLGRGARVIVPGEQSPLRLG